MKVKTGLSKPKPLKKSLSGAIQKKKLSKPTSGALKNIVKITDAFEDLKSGKELTGISCSKEPKSVKKTAVKASKESKKDDIKLAKNSIDIKKKTAVAPKEKKLKKENEKPKISLKSKVLESKVLNADEGNPKLDIDKVN